MACGQVANWEASVARISGIKLRKGHFRRLDRRSLWQERLLVFMGCVPDEAALSSWSENMQQAFQRTQTVTALPDDLLL